MTPVAYALLALLLLLAVLIGWRIGVASSQKDRGRRSKARNRRAGIGEQGAEMLLEEAGYRILDRQVVALWWIEIDGKKVELEVRADFLVERTSDRVRFVAEVKTGAKAPDPTFPATRRQLLEYAHVFHPHRVLLVEPEEARIREVRFPEFG